ncbi:MAG: beta-lactamase family protein [Flavobacteriia bacterium]|nr:beta-lactamase family protein [Flavobacteriia bacterium]MBH2023893.1 beta-lactamase family protein [Flavobacteriales bacterium]
MVLKIYSNYFLFLFFILISCKSEPAKIADDSVTRNAIIDSTITALQKKLLAQQIDSVFSKTKFNGSISVVQNGEKLYERENGLEDFKTKAKLDSNSVFAIGSVSKQFTAVMILMLEDQGKLNTNDKISKFLPEFQNKQFESITVHQLLNHTSGISDLGNGLHSKPGKEFNYSNKGYRFLGEIIEKASGKSYEENAEELFGKAGMLHSSTANVFNGDHFAGAYLGNPSRFERIENMPKRLSNKEISVAAGGVLSTVNDLHRWNTSLYSGKILKPETLKKFLQKSSENHHAILGKVGYGYGIMINERKQPSYFHSGYVKGSPSLNIYYPETKTSVVILSNIADESKGKNGFFVPHKEVKKVTEIIENAVTDLRKEMIK